MIFIATRLYDSIPSLKSSTSICEINYPSLLVHIYSIKEQKGNTFCCSGKLDDSSIFGTNNIEAMISISDVEINCSVIEP